LIGGTLHRQEKSRKVLMQVVKSLTSKFEIGTLMAALYLLGNPGHYFSHRFTPLHWKNFVYEARRDWNPDE
ncbi:hypothetical protein BV22DRAFT_991670, partial [Leucogyrophana mollusca]